MASTIILNSFRKTSDSYTVNHLKPPQSSSKSSSNKNGTFSAGVVVDKSSINTKNGRKLFSSSISTTYTSSSSSSASSETSSQSYWSSPSSESEDSSDCSRRDSDDPVIDLSIIKTNTSETTMDQENLDSNQPEQQEQKIEHNNNDIIVKVNINQENYDNSSMIETCESCSSCSKINPGFVFDDDEVTTIIDDDQKQHKQQPQLFGQPANSRNNDEIIIRSPIDDMMMMMKTMANTNNNNQQQNMLDNSFISLFVNGKRCLLMLNNDHLTYEPELTTSPVSKNERVSIKLSNVLNAWICVCRQHNYNYQTNQANSSSRKLFGIKSIGTGNGKIPKLCECIVSRSNSTSSSSSTTSSPSKIATIMNNLMPGNNINNNIKLINPSKKQKPFVVKIYYINETNSNSNSMNDDENKIQNPQGFKLEMLILSVVDPNDPNGNKKISSNQILNQEDDLSIHKQTQFLAEIAYGLRKKLQMFDRPKNLLLFINPFGGNKKGVDIYNDKIKPILQLSNVESKVIITKQANEANEIIKDLDTDLSQFDGIICVGGDGMFGEILNGILIRTQKENEINFDLIDSTLIKPTIKLGIIPAGSTDAVVYATNGYKEPLNSILSIVFGRTMNIDVGAVHHRDEEKLIRYTASFMGYGFFGDTILESERLRWMGPKRYDWAGLKKFLKHRLYSGEIKLCIEPSDGSPEEYNPCSINCPTCKHAGIKSAEQLNAEDAPACISIRGRFLAINSAILSCRCAKSKYGMSPMAHVGNGCTDLILISKCTRFEYLRYLFSLAFHTKSPFEFDFVDTYRVREFEFNPIIEPHKRKGYMFEKSVDCDFFDAFDEEFNNNCRDDFIDNDNDKDVAGSSSKIVETNDKSSSSNNLNRKRYKKNNRKMKNYHHRSLTSSVWNCDGEIINEPAIHVKIHCQLVKIFANGFNVEQILDRSKQQQQQQQQPPQQQTKSSKKVNFGPDV